MLLQGRIPSITRAVVGVLLFVLVRAPWVLVHDAPEWAPDSGHMPLSLTTDATPATPQPTNVLAVHVRLPTGSRECNHFVLDAGLAHITGAKTSTPLYALAWVWQGETALDNSGFRITIPPLLWNGTITIPASLVLESNQSAGAAHTLFATHRFEFPSFPRTLITTPGGYWFGLTVALPRMLDPATNTRNEVRWLYTTRPVNTTRQYMYIDRYGNAAALRHTTLRNWTNATVAEPWLSNPLNVLSTTKHLAIRVSAQCLGPIDPTNPVILANGPLPLWTPQQPGVGPSPAVTPIPSPLAIPTSTGIVSIPPLPTSPIPVVVQPPDVVTPSSTPDIRTPSTPTVSGLTPIATPTLSGLTPTLSGLTPTVNTPTNNPGYAPSSEVLHTSTIPVIVTQESPSPVPTGTDRLYAGVYISREVAIGLGVSGGIIALVLVAVILYVAVSRQRKRDQYEQVEALHQQQNFTQKHDLAQGWVGKAKSWFGIGNKKKNGGSVVPDSVDEDDDIQETPLVVLDKPEGESSNSSDNDNTSRDVVDKEQELPEKIFYMDEEGKRIPDPAEVAAEVEKRRMQVVTLEKKSGSGSGESKEKGKGKGPEKGKK